MKYITICKSTFGFVVCLTLLLACSQTIAPSKSGLVASDTQNHPVKTILHSRFSDLKLGKTTNERLLTQYPSMKWAQSYDRVQVVQKGKQKVLSVEYPKGSVGPSEGGAQWVWKLPEKEEYILTYSVKFEEGFDFRLGGKLPGLTSGGEKWTGGNRPLNGEGWSARLMWREQGMAELYLYYLGMKGKWGDSINLSQLQFETGKWYNIRERIRVNTPGDNNAIIQIWINDELLLDMQNFRLRLSETGKIDSAYFSTFHGGNQPKWGPHNHSKALFGDFHVFY